MSDLQQYIADSLGCQNLVHIVGDTLSYNNSVSHLTSESQMISENVVKGILKILKTRKSCGMDNIRNAFLKNLPDSAVKHLTFIFNACLKFQYFPTTWRTGLCQFSSQVNQIIRLKAIVR